MNVYREGFEVNSFFKGREQGTEDRGQQPVGGSSRSLVDEYDKETFLFELRA
jgi:hypothetical protein